MPDTSLFELMGKVEQLHPELETYLEEHPTLGQVLKHPLVFQVPYMKELSALSNKQLELKKQYVEEARAEKNWSQVVWLHERPYRLQAFLDIESELRNKEYWEMAGGIWIDSENIWQNLPEWKRILSSKRDGKENLMDAEEQEQFERLPDRVKIYRGFQPGINKNGLSYTLEPKVAQFFAKRYIKKGEPFKVRERVVAKKDILALLGGRSEHEIIIKPAIANR